MNDMARALAKLRYAANREGLEIGLAVLWRAWSLYLRFSPRNAWIGVRYTDFMPSSRTRFVSVQIIPMLAIQFAWRHASARRNSQVN
jgi:hypothetical protein